MTDALPLANALLLRISNACDLLTGLIQEGELARHSEPAKPRLPAATIARQLIRLRRARETIFGAELFADPAWDMLLDLLIAEDEGRNISLSSLCIAATVPSTTALRWIRMLEKSEAIVCTPHPRDKRSRTVRLAPRASERLRSLLVSLAPPACDFA